MMPSHDAHHLALKRQGKVGQVHRNVCKNQKSVLSFNPKKLFKDIMVKRTNSLEKIYENEKLEEGFGIWKSTVMSSEIIEVGSRNIEFRQEEVQDRLKTYLRMCTMMRRKI